MEKRARCPVPSRNYASGRASWGWVNFIDYRYSEHNRLDLREPPTPEVPGMRSPRTPVNTGCGGPGARGVRFHDLRHTCGTLLLIKGAHPKVVSEELGARASPSSSTPTAT